MNKTVVTTVAGASLWLIGCLSIIISLLFGLRQIRQITRDSMPLGPETLQMANESQRAMGLSRSVYFLRASLESALAIPVTWGLFQPRILLPPQSRDWSVDCVRAALLHELAHVQRRDWTTQMLGRLACALYWWHPLVWLAAYQARAESERACDDCVLQAGVRAADYAQRLVEVARSIPAGGTLRTVAVSMAQPSEVEGRVKSVLARGRDRRPISQNYVLAFSVTLILILLPLSMLHLVARAQAPVPPFSAQEWQEREQQSETNMRRISFAILEYKHDQDQRLPSLKSIDLLEKDLKPYLEYQEMHPEKFPQFTTQQHYSAHGAALFISPLTGQPYRLNTALSNIPLAKAGIKQSMLLVTGTAQIMKHAPHGAEVFQNFPPSIIARNLPPGSKVYYKSHAVVAKIWNHGSPAYIRGTPTVFKVEPIASMVLFQDTPTTMPGGTTRWVLEAFADGHVKSRQITPAVSAQDWQEREQQAEGNMKRISTAILEYQQDHDNVLPSLKSISLLAKDLEPYLKQQEKFLDPTTHQTYRVRGLALFVSPLTGKPYRLNSALSNSEIINSSDIKRYYIHKPLPTTKATHGSLIRYFIHMDMPQIAPRAFLVKSPASLVLFHDAPMTVPGGTTQQVLEAFADGHVKGRSIMQASGPAPTDKAQHVAYVKAIRSISNLKQISLAILQYAQDHDEHLPSFRSIALLERDLQPYLLPSTDAHRPDAISRYHSMFVSGISGKPYLLASGLSGKPFASIPLPAEAVLMHDIPVRLAQGQPPVTLEAYADGHVKIKGLSRTSIPLSKTPQNKPKITWMRNKAQIHALDSHLFQTNETMNAMKQIALATLQYAQDHNEHLPSLASVSALKHDIAHYLKPMGHDPLVSPLTGKPYCLNASLSHRPLAKISAPAETVLLSDAPTTVPGDKTQQTLEAYVDGHVKIRNMNLQGKTKRAFINAVKAYNIPERQMMNTLNSSLAGVDDRTKTLTWKSMNNLEQISLAILEYAQDHNNTLPSLQSIATLAKDLRPYHVETSESFVSPLTGKPYNLNAVLSNKPITAYAKPASTVLMSDTMTESQSSKIQWKLIAFADGHVMVQTNRRWAVAPSVARAITPSPMQIHAATPAPAGVTAQEWANVKTTLANDTRKNLTQISTQYSRYVLACEREDVSQLQQVTASDFRFSWPKHIQVSRPQLLEAWKHHQELPVTTADPYDLVFKHAAFGDNLVRLTVIINSAAPNSWMGLSDSEQQTWVKSTSGWRLKAIDRTNRTAYF